MEGTLASPGVMSEPLEAQGRKVHVLLIEDNPADVRLVREMLTDTEGSTHFELEHNDLLSTGLARMARGNVDIVLLDLSLPDSQGLATIERAYHNAPNLPIVVLTGLDDEQLAIQAVQRGAQDYLVKTYVHVRMLSRVMHYAIERKQAERRVREVEERYRTIFENSAVAITVTDEQERIISWNKFAEKLFGMDYNDLYLRPVHTLYPQEEWDKIRSFNVRQKGMQDHLDTRMIRKSGEVIEVDISITVLKDADGKITGSIGITRDLTERKRAAREAHLVEVREQEIEIGSKIQQMLLLGAPPRDFPGLSVGALTVPSQRIDGDFYDFVKHNDQCFDVIVGDVMGKGVPAALLGAAIKNHFLRALVRLVPTAGYGKLPEPKEIVSLVHSEMTRQLIELESFVTLCYARFDLEKRRIDFVDCGHPKTICYRSREKKCEMLQGKNTPLGFRKKEVYEQVTASFEPGDLFFFYSDGVTEAQNPEGEFYGEERLAEFIRANSALKPTDLVDTLRKTIITFSSKESFADDLTCVSVRIDAAPTACVGHAEFEIPSRLSELPHVRQFVQGVFRDYPSLEPERASELELAIHEAITNIIKHAYKGREDKRIEIKADIFEDKMIFRLYHWGEPFHPKETTPPVFDGSQESGFGLYIIGRSVDEVIHAQDEFGTNYIDLVKLLKAQ